MDQNRRVKRCINGTAYIADWIDDRWDIAECEWADIMWRPVSPTEQLLKLLSLPEMAGELR